MDICVKNLLEPGLEEIVKPTSLSRKLTINGVTKAYPVYRVRLDQLFYNDQNDRIATWISQYKSEQGADVFQRLDRDRYNAIIEQFIIQSNEAAIEKTQMNIALVNQREPGVILADGRIIDGNRRFTCLRRLAAKDEAFNWFETVILATDIESNQKQIKMLELAIQHGEEKKVDYNPIDRLVGVYQDIVETELLTVEEYAYSTNESVFEVKKRLDSALLLVEFLDYIHMPKQWHIARDYQVVSVIADLQPLLRKCATVEMQQQVKETVFSNILMRTIGDSRKYIRNLSKMMESGLFMAYIKDQDKIGQELKERLEEREPEGKRDLDRFVEENQEMAESMELSLDKSLLKAKKRETRNRPSQIVSKSITLLRDVDTNIFEKLTDQEKDNLKTQLDRLSTVVERFDTMISDEEPATGTNGMNGDQERGTIPAPAQEKSVASASPTRSRYYIAVHHPNEPFVVCKTSGKTISNLVVTLEFEAFYPGRDTEASSEYSCRAFFLDPDHQAASDEQILRFQGAEACRATFALSSRLSEQKECLLAIQSLQDEKDELKQLIPFRVSIAFASDFGL